MTDAAHRTGLLPRSAFTDPALYDSEQGLIGENCWALIGPVEWVASDGDWMTGRIADREVFVQRFGERLVGFENVCSHRFSEIREKRRGNGIIRCPYHHWTFNAEGVPVGIPHCRELFGVAPHELSNRRLRPIEVASKGNLMFGRLLAAAGKPGLDGGLGRWSSLLDALEGRTLEMFGEVEQTMHANWKLGFQNTLDEYHITAVHPKSFGSGGWLVPGEFRYEVDGQHDAMILKRAGLGDVNAEQVVSAVAQGTPLPVDYAIYHYFPDLLIGFVAGRIVMVTRYEAMSVGETRVRTYLLDMLPPGGAALSDQKRKAMGSYVSTVLEEDREAVERWSRGVRQSWDAPLYGWQEQRLEHFERSWLALFPGRTPSGVTLNPAMATKVTLRAAIADDARDLLVWRNDPVTRQMSRSTEKIARDAHLKWYASALADPARMLLVGCIDGVSFGMARFDLLAPDTWEVSINLDPAQRGKGLSRPLLAAALKSIEARHPSVIVAEIKPINAVSRHLFESLGFRRVAGAGTMDRFELAPGRSG